MPFAAVLFDLDGTLLDTLEDVADAVNRALASLSLPAHPVESYRGFIGEGVAVLARRVLPPCRQTEADAQAVLAAIFREYLDGPFVKTKPFPGIGELLAELATRRVGCAVVSNKPHALSLRTVNTFFPNTTFGAVLGQRQGVPRKPDPAGALEAAVTLGAKPENCLYVGDSGIDMKTAEAAGMFGVGVLWGFRGREELVENGARVLIKHPLELLRVQERTFESPAGISGTYFS